MSTLLIDLNSIYNYILKEFDNFSINYSYGDVDSKEHDMYLLEKDPNLKLEIWNNFKGSNFILSNKVAILQNKKT
ncbi:MULTISPECIES: hypothetical protein [Macrococcoides]|uniref:hypothetical protein n=1 Tax=Macrococcoides TaxID=3076173 RepID=UPI00165D6E8A|nr:MULTISPECIES: hypothetical protein [Macrococcus]MBC9875693.1 hypothetical protein [Macrococcus bohemicus]MCO4097271.1 hypothetical protein [Macrococcus canis]UTH06702.1 hypothetical protein KFV07_11275 [Macrococcus canis]UTH09053.1 hypothetical protein KFV08_11305 [Macrococcus canis]